MNAMLKVHLIVLNGKLRRLAGEIEELTEERDELAASLEADAKRELDLHIASVGARIEENSANTRAIVAALQEMIRSLSSPSRSTRPPSCL